MGFAQGEEKMATIANLSNIEQKAFEAVRDVLKDYVKPDRLKWIRNTQPHYFTIRLDGRRELCYIVHRMSDGKLSYISCNRINDGYFKEEISSPDDILSIKDKLVYKLKAIAQEENIALDEQKLAPLTAQNPPTSESPKKWQAESLALINKGDEFYKDKNYEEAIKCYDKVVLLEPDVISALNQKKAQVFFDWGNTLYKSAKINENEDLFKKAFDKYDKAIQYSESDTDSDIVLYAFDDWGDALCYLTKTKPDKILLREAIDKYKKAVQRKEYAWAIINLGDALFNLAKIEQDEDLFREAIEKYDKVIKQKYDGVIKQNKDYDCDAFIKRGIVFVNLAEIKQDESLYKNVTESFKKAKKSILGIFAYLNKEETEQIINKKVLYPLLNSDTEDGNFFIEATSNIKDISQEELNRYKEIYIRSIFIISQLHINRKYEKSVAYYTKKVIAQKLLLGDKSKFRLNAIDNSNDPKEGKTLLDYLFKDKPSKEEKLDTEYRAFAGCFTFQHDSLNQFRLYGKDNDKEGTGLSLVFSEDFFSRELRMATEKDGEREILLTNMPFDYKNENKYTLFRCIYIDPKKQQVKTVGQSEITDGKYKEYIDSVFDIVNKKMEELRNLVIQKPDLNQNVIGQLLINLRYLTKHIAFKEEQECRIVRICNINNKTDIIHFDDEKMYIIYEPKILYQSGPDIIPRIEKIYFGPKATNMELFEDRLAIELKCKIKCKKSENPLA